MKLILKPKENRYCNILDKQIKTKIIYKQRKPNQDHNNLQAKKAKSRSIYFTRKESLNYDMPMVVRRSQVKKVNKIKYFISNERHYQFKYKSTSSKYNIFVWKNIKVSTYEKNIDIPYMIHIILLADNPQNSNMHDIHHAAKSQHSWHTHMYTLFYVT